MADWAMHTSVSWPTSTTSVLPKASIASRISCCPYRLKTILLKTLWPGGRRFLSNGNNSTVSDTSSAVATMGISRAMATCMIQAIRATSGSRSCSANFERKLSCTSTTTKTLLARSISGMLFLPLNQRSLSKEIRLEVSQRPLPRACNCA